MKTALFIIVILGSTFALPSLDWSNIRSNNVYMQPIGNFSQPLLPRIIGGKEAEPHSKPYQAAVVIDGNVFCGGSLISPRYVLTAAHCIHDHQLFQVILGAHNIRNSEASQVLLTSSTSIVHPSYNASNLNNDVALIRLPSAVSLNDHIQTISLTPATSGSFVDVQGTLTGWGKLSDEDTTITSILQQVEVPIMANFWCSRSYGTNVVVDSTLCTSGVGVVGGCDGDSGGALVVDGVQVGIASFVAATGCEQGLPTGYARITSFRSWIVQNAQLD